MLPPYTPKVGKRTAQKSSNIAQKAIILHTLGVQDVLKRVLNALRLDSLGEYLPWAPISIDSTYIGPFGALGLWEFFVMATTKWFKQIWEFTDGALEVLGIDYFEPSLCGSLQNEIICFFAVSHGLYRITGPGQPRTPTTLTCCSSFQSFFRSIESTSYMWIFSMHLHKELSRIPITGCLPICQHNNFV